MISGLGEVHGLRTEDGLQLVHFFADGIHQNLACKDRIVRNGNALVLAERDTAQRKADCGEAAKSDSDRPTCAPAGSDHHAAPAVHRLAALHALPNPRNSEARRTAEATAISSPTTRIVQGGGTPSSRVKLSANVS